MRVIYRSFGFAALALGGVSSALILLVAGLWFFARPLPWFPPTFQHEPLTLILGSLGTGLFALGRFLHKAADRLPMPAASAADHNYLRQVEQQLRELSRHPLAHTDDELIALQAEHIQPVYHILKTVDDGRTHQQGKMTRDLVKALLGTDRPMVVLGDPGSGKSVTLRTVGQTLARRGLREASPLLPVYLPLGNFTREISDPPNAEELVTAARDFVKDSLRRQGGHALRILEHFDEHLAAGRFVFLLDAMDEMPRNRIELRFQALSELRKFTGNRLLFACRKLNFLESFAFERAIIQPLNRRQVYRFLVRSLGDLGPRAAGDILSHENPLRDMAENPFFLKLLALFYKAHGELPDHRAALMREYEEQVFDRARKRDGFPARLTLEIFRSVLAHLAYTITRSGRGVTISIDTFVSGVQAAGPSRGDVTTVLDVAASERLLLIETELPGEAPGEVVKFHHHRLQEYYAAVYLDQYGQSQSLVWDVDLDDIWWQEVLIMSCGITADPDIFIDVLMGRVPRHALVCWQLAMALGRIARKDGDPAVILESIDSENFYGLRSGSALDAAADDPFLILSAGVLHPRRDHVYDWLVALWSAEPDANESADWTRRWLERRNAVLFDRIELITECLRNTGRPVRPAVAEALSGVLSEFVDDGNTWEIVRAVSLLPRLAQKGLLPVLQPALMTGNSWSRGEALEALAGHRATDVSTTESAFIILIQFAKGELLTSLPHFVRALGERHSLARLVPGVLLLSLVSLAVLLAPLGATAFLRWRFPHGIPGVNGLWGFGWQEWSAWLGVACAAIVYLWRAVGHVPIIRTTTLLAVAALWGQWLFDRWQFTARESGEKYPFTVEGAVNVLREFLTVVWVTLLTGAALAAPYAIEFTLIACMTAIILVSGRLFDSTLAKFPVLYFNGLVRLDTHLELLGEIVVPIAVMAAATELAVGFGLVVTLVALYLYQFSIGRIVFAIGAAGLVLASVRILSRHARRLWNMRAEFRPEGFLPHMPAIDWTAAVAFIRKYRWLALLPGVWMVLYMLGVFEYIRQVVTFVVPLMSPYLVVAAIVVGAVTAVWLVSKALYRVSLEAIDIVRTREAIRDERISSTERFDLLRQSLRHVRRPWVRAFLYREMAKNHRAARHERARERD